MILTTLIILFHVVVSLSRATDYKVGVGISDCTGPAADIVFMGYAKTKQKGCGIHLRQFSRAFVFDDGNKTVVFVSVDAAMVGHALKKKVLSRLNLDYGLNNKFTYENVIISGTHTHGTPGGFLHDLMYDIPSFGYVRQTFEALTIGIAKSITKAYENLVPAKIYLSSGQLLDANINRSPAAYLLNPAEERAKFDYDVDKELWQLKIIRAEDKSVMGAINWFAVHPTSMNNTNCLITTDNVGLASILLEQHVNKNELIGKGQFVGAFASTNLGDVSPNIMGPRCIDTGLKCDTVSSTCNGNAQNCIAFGPGKDMFESTEIIARRLFAMGKKLLTSKSGTEINGPIKFIHQFVDMPSQNVTYSYSNGTSKKVNGCLPAMGYSFAAGTTDGPGEFTFQQGTITSNPFWNLVRDVIFPPTHEDITCQHPKPILINTGRISKPYQWQPRIVSIQLIQLGEVILIAVPGEFTTMSGRRLRHTVKDIIIANGGPASTSPIITGLSNVYTSYIATTEEYQLQRYEGASTIFGPYTLPIYLKLYAQLAEAMSQNRKVDSGPTPPDLSEKLISLQPKVKFDTAGLMHHYGDVIEQPPEQVARGSIVQARFISGHPRNNLQLGKSFLYIEKQIGDSSDKDKWETVATDANWETKFIWQRSSLMLFGGSEATVQWHIPMDVVLGTYRIKHHGHYKYFWGGEIYPYSGISNSFQVI